MGNVVPGSLLSFGHEDRAEGSGWHAEVSLHFWMTIPKSTDVTFFREPTAGPALHCHFRGPALGCEGRRWKRNDGGIPWLILQIQNPSVRVRPVSQLPRRAGGMPRVRPRASTARWKCCSALARLLGKVWASQEIEDANQRQKRVQYSKHSPRCVRCCCNGGVRIGDSVVLFWAGDNHGSDVCWQPRLADWRCRRWRPWLAFRMTEPDLIAFSPHLSLRLSAADLRRFDGTARMSRLVGCPDS